MTVEKCLPHDWRPLSEKAHLVVFGNKKPESQERIDFALLAVDEGKTVSGYVTCQERDSESIYWQFGGTFPGTRGSTKSLKVMRSLIQWCLSHYSRISFLVENTNTSMLKLALLTGFQVVGLRAFQGSILLEHLLERSWT